MRFKSAHFVTSQIVCLFIALCSISWFQNVVWLVLFLTISIIWIFRIQKKILVAVFTYFRNIIGQPQNLVHSFSRSHLTKFIHVIILPFSKYVKLLCIIQTFFQRSFRERALIIGKFLSSMTLCEKPWLIRCWCAEIEIVRRFYFVDVDWWRHSESCREICLILVCYKFVFFGWYEFKSLRLSFKPQIISDSKLLRILLNFTSDLIGVFLND